MASSQLTTSLFMVVLGVGMGLLMQTTNLVMQNSVERKDIGAASGASTLFRTIGGSLSVSLLGVLYSNGVTDTLTERLGAAQAGSVAGGRLTPALLTELPAAVREAYQAAVTTGVTTAFLWAGVAMLAAVIAAWLVRERPLRATVGTPEEAEAISIAG